MARLRHFEYSFTANQRIAINATGNIIFCDQGSEVFDVEPDQLEKIELQAGLGLTFENEFKKIVITNGATAQTIKVYIGDGSILNSRAYGNLTVKQAGANTLTDVADQSIGATVTDTIAANADRARIMIQADLSNHATSFLRVGPNAAATRGIVLIPGASYWFNTTDEIKVYSPVASQTYRYIEESHT